MAAVTFTFTTIRVISLRLAQVQQRLNSLALAIVISNDDGSSQAFMELTVESDYLWFWHLQSTATNDVMIAVCGNLPAERRGI